MRFLRAERQPQRLLLQGCCGWRRWLTAADVPPGPGWSLPSSALHPGFLPDSWTSAPGPPLDAWLQRQWVSTEFSARAPPQTPLGGWPASRLLRLPGRWLHRPLFRPSLPQHRCVRSNFHHKLLTPNSWARFASPSGSDSFQAIYIHCILTTCILDS